MRETSGLCFNCGGLTTIQADSEKPVKNLYNQRRGVSIKLALVIFTPTGNRRQALGWRAGPAHAIASGSGGREPDAHPTSDAIQIRIRIISHHFHHQY